MTDETNFDFSDITRSAYIEPHRNSLIFVIRELQKTLPDDEYIQKFVGKLNGVDTKDWSVQEAVDMYNVGLSRAIHAVIQSITEKHIDLLEEEDSETIEAFMESILCMCYQTIDEHEDVSRIALSQRMTLQAIKLEGKSPEYKAFINMALYIATFFYPAPPCSKPTSFIAFT
ncbi:MAG: hypothetical protein OXR68_01780, partial [Alphaproteobacteria bacterium]|nr:hypothetical protein [Alphaproteobacteria bacterium]